MSNEIEDFDVDNEVREKVIKFAESLIDTLVRQDKFAKDIMKTLDYEYDLRKLHDIIGKALNEVDFSAVTEQSGYPEYIYRHSLYESISMSIVQEATLEGKKSKEDEKKDDPMVG